jgi:hypothetical protein
MLDPKTTPIDEEHLMNVEIKMLKLSLTQLSKHEEKSALRVMNLGVDRSMRLMWDCPSLPLNANTLVIYLKFIPTF